MTLTPNAVLVPPGQMHARGRAETHTLAFLSRYRVAQTRGSYGLSLRQWFRWCGDNGIDPLDVTRAQIEIFAHRTAWAVGAAIGDRTSGPVLLTKSGIRLDRRGAARIVGRVARAGSVTKRITPIPCATPS